MTRAQSPSTMSAILSPAPAPEFRLIRLPGRYPEDVLLDAEGRLLCGLEGGAIARVHADGSDPQVVANTGGRPLGLDWMPDGRLAVCDSDRGLLAIDLRSGVVDLLADSVDGERMLVCNNLSVARDGTIYFSDSSRRHSLAAIQADIVEHIPTGRLLQRDPDGRVHVLMTGLQFANGVVLSADESFVLVAETGGSCIRRYWLAGAARGRSEVFASQLPGLPDNMSLGSDGLFWVALPSATDRRLQAVHRLPGMMRRVISRLPDRLASPSRRALAMGFDGSGKCVHFVEADPLRYHLITGVRERAGCLYVSSIEESALAMIRIPLSSQTDRRAVWKPPPEATILPTS